jgi:hypothetical protein
VRRASAAFAACLLAVPAWAHELGGSPVHPLLSPLPDALKGVTVEVAETMAPEILVANHTAHTLEILDAQGRPFLRIGPEGVGADLASAAWYRSLTAAGVTPPKTAAPFAPPHWASVMHDPAFGWFDPRISVAQVKVPDEIEDAGKPATVGTWSVSVRIGGTNTAITGTFAFQPRPKGQFDASVTPPAGFPAGISVRVVPGATPALFLQNSSRHSVTVLGLQGEPYVRIGPDGVAVNEASTTWQQLGREQRSTAKAGWIQLSRQPAYAWMEPRAAAPSPWAQDHRGRTWTVPVRVDGTDYLLRGAVVWRE